MLFDLLYIIFSLSRASQRTHRKWVSRKFPGISVLTSNSWWKSALLHLHQISFKCRKLSQWRAFSIVTRWGVSGCSLFAFMEITVMLSVKISLWDEILQMEVRIPLPQNDEKNKLCQAVSLYSCSSYGPPEPPTAVWLPDTHEYFRGKAMQPSD